MILRQLEYLSALAREGHFGRAARACHVTQPALSVGIRKLESELGVELVRRGPTHQELTPQGAALLGWARQALASVDGLSAEASRLANSPAGRLRVGVIPTALPAVATITKPLLERFPSIELEVRGLPSVEIAEQVNAYALDAGITYLAGVGNTRLTATPVYDERYLLLTADPSLAGATAGWGELDGVPLCLLTADMQNRRIVDAALAAAGARASARIETDSISALLSFARSGWSSVVSSAWLDLYGVPEGMRAIALVEPEVAEPIGVLSRGGDFVPPLVTALLRSLPR